MVALTANTSTPHEEVGHSRSRVVAQKPVAHRALGEALRMRARGEADIAVLSSLRSRGLDEREARSAFLAIDRQIGHRRAVARRVRSLVIASVIVQLLVALAMVSLDVAAAPLPAIVLLAVLARVCRADANEVQRLTRRRHLFC